jgi:hypothetical protein
MHVAIDDLLIVVLMGHAVEHLLHTELAGR